MADTATQCAPSAATWAVNFADALDELDAISVEVASLREVLAAALPPRLDAHRQLRAALALAEKIAAMTDRATSHPHAGDAFRLREQVEGQRHG